MRVVPALTGTNRMADQDITLGGYLIPRNTMIWCNLNAMFSSPDVWHDPEQYIPVRAPYSLSHCAAQSLIWNIPGYQKGPVKKPTAKKHDQSQVCATFTRSRLSYVIVHLQERWEACGAEYVQTADDKAAAPGISVKVAATGHVPAPSQTAASLEDTEKENEHRVRPALLPVSHSTAS